MAEAEVLRPVGIDAARVPRSGTMAVVPIATQKNATVFARLLEVTRSVKQWERLRPGRERSGGRRCRPIV